MTLHQDGGCQVTKIAAALQQQYIQCIASLLACALGLLQIFAEHISIQ